MAENVSFYVGLYYDSECTQPAAPSQELAFVNDVFSEVTFNNLEPGREYYVGECDAAGNVIYSGKVSGGETYHAKFTGTNGNYVLTEKGGSTQISLDNQMDELPDGFYIAGRLHVTKKLLGTDGMPVNSDKVFYAGIFDDPEYTIPSESVDYNLLELDLAGGSTAENTAAVILPTTDSTVTLYVTEVDEDGEPVAGTPGFAYQVSVNGTQQTISAENLNAYVVITNQEKEEKKEEKQEEKKELEKSNAENKRPDTRNVPPTGDETPILPLAAAAAVSGLAAALLLYRRRRRRM